MSRKHLSMTIEKCNVALVDIVGVFFEFIAFSITLEKCNLALVDTVGVWRNVLNQQNLTGNRLKTCFS